MSGPPPWALHLHLRTGMFVCDVGDCLHRVTHFYHYTVGVGAGGGAGVCGCGANCRQPLTVNRTSPGHVHTSTHTQDFDHRDDIRGKAQRDPRWAKYIELSRPHVQHQVGVPRGVGVGGRRGRGGGGM